MLVFKSVLSITISCKFKLGNPGHREDAVQKTAKLYHAHKYLFYCIGNQLFATRVIIYEQRVIFIWFGCCYICNVYCGNYLM